MSETSIYTRHRDLLISLLFSSMFFILDIRNIVDISGVRGLFAFSAFTLVIAAILTGMIIFQKYETVIGKAKNKGLMPAINKVFKYPLIASIFGAIFTFLVTNVDISLDILSANNLRLLSIGADSLIIFLVIYSLTSLYEGALFLYRVVIGESTSPD